MKAAIVTIGDEILIGQIVDTNSGFIAKTLDKIGIEITEMLSISDHKTHILETFASLQNKVDLVLITGGLGPTKDDITKKTFCDYFEDELIVNQEILEHVTQLIEGFYKRPINQMNKDQALVPSKCIILKNPNGTAPGMWMQKEHTVFISLPGVPYEMKDILENEIVPKIVREYNRPFIIHQTVLTYGQGESMVAERIEDWENNLPDFIKLAYLPSPGRVRLRLSARGNSEEVLKNALSDQIKQLTELIGDIIVGYDDNDTIEVVLGRVLTQNKLTLATAESCTGGKIAQRITSVAGASAYFKGSIVCYSEEVKTAILKVSKQTIADYSVVSEQVAKEMALNVQQLMNVDYAIAVTGNAGPTKDATDEEVGTVFIALASPEMVFVEKFNFGQPREKVIDRAVNKSFEILQKEILKNVQ
ncbi:competence/damage-inducible protein A [Flavobacterium sp.]|jgi:nicotinamide-nucleotide amidase|uniref:competence/damage-inducible protein A n=1 Tax=Flavobacterium sp. TaxID=239 RepID=UPI0037BF6DC6